MTAARGPASRAKDDARSRSGGITVTLETELGSAEFHPLPVQQWRGSVRRAVEERVDDAYFAEKCLPASEQEKWFELDPTMLEFAEFLKAVIAASGDDMGESTAS